MSHPTRLLPLLTFAVAALSARADIEFIGVLIMPGRSAFALTEDPARSTAATATGFYAPLS